MNKSIISNEKRCGVCGKKEVWKNIKGYEGLYKISNLGQIKSIPRNGTIKEERIIKQYKDRYGYMYCSLNKENEKKKYKIHRLLAIAFIPNPNNMPQVNHKDENTLNNNIDNLEWCSAKYNLCYGKRLDKLRKKIIAIDNKNNEHIFNSIKEASEILNIDSSLITKVCKNKRNQAGGYRFNYYEKI